MTSVAIRLAPCQAATAGRHSKSTRLLQMRGGAMRKVRFVLIFQIFLLAISILAVSEMAINFPYPSPLIKPFLSPKLKWPTAEIIGWIETQTIDPSFGKFFYRDPDRSVPSGQNIVAAADGVVQYAS